MLASLAQRSSFTAFRALATRPATRSVTATSTLCRAYSTPSPSSQQAAPSTPTKNSSTAGSTPGTVPDLPKGDGAYSVIASLLKSNFMGGLGEAPTRRASDLPDMDQQWRQRSAHLSLRLPQIKDAYYGRSVPVVKGDVESAYRKLSRVLGQNQVVRELRANERHEKVGVKRRRLRSERWRRRFAHEVRKKVQLVQAIRARGS